MISLTTPLVSELLSREVYQTVPSGCIAHEVATVPVPCPGSAPCEAASPQYGGAESSLASLGRPPCDSACFGCELLLAFTSAAERAPMLAASEVVGSYPSAAAAQRACGALLHSGDPATPLPCYYLPVVAAHASVPFSLRLNLPPIRTSIVPGAVFGALVLIFSALAVFFKFRAASLGGIDADLDATSAASMPSAGSGGGVATAVPTARRFRLWSRRSTTFVRAPADLSAAGGPSAMLPSGWDRASSAPGGQRGAGSRSADSELLTVNPLHVPTSDRDGDGGS